MPDDGSRAPTPRAVGFYSSTDPRSPRGCVRRRTWGRTDAMSKLDDWLKELGLEEYSSVLVKNDIDFDVVLDLEERDLEKLGFSLGHGRKLMRAIEARKLAPGPRQTTPSPEAPAGTTAAR